MIKKIIFYLMIFGVLFLFFFPFVGTWINYKTSFSFGDLYTFGIADRKDFFTLWIALFGAIGIAFNIYQNHLRTTNQDKQIELQSKSQRDSRFSKGVELLGNANESARTGAAYSLFFLAKDYSEEFAKPVFEILCSHVRSITITEEYKKNNNERPSNEIQSILDLLFGDDQSKHIFNGLRADFKYSYLIGAKLRNVNLLRADLSEANLSRANLSEANLSRANLSEANLSRAHLSEANLSIAHLPEVILSDAYLSRADLSRANLYRANLYRAYLSSANLSDAYLSRADLSRANLSRANLYRVIIDDTIFSEATSLDGVDMSQIDLNKIEGKINPKYLLNPDNETNADSQ